MGSYQLTEWEMGLDELYLRTYEFAKVGKLLLQKGRWNGE